MGCGIHPHIEYTEYEDKDGKPIWWHWGDFFFLRDYGLFAYMAGVRNYDKVTPVAEPRGVPNDMTFETKDAYTCLVAERDDEYALTRVDADGYVARGASTWLTSPDDTYPRISCPDWHTPSWLNADEFEAAINRAEQERSGKCNPNVHAALAVMRTFEKAGRQARIVFWFDN